MLEKELPSLRSEFEIQKETYINSLTMLAVHINTIIEDAHCNKFVTNPLRGNVVAHICELYGALWYLDKLLK
jgi:hypothetical protein